MLANVRNIVKITISTQSGRYEDREKKCEIEKKEKKNSNRDYKENSAIARHRLRKAPSKDYASQDISVATFKHELFSIIPRTTVAFMCMCMS